jgi:hypothetical protein
MSQVFNAVAGVVLKPLVAALDSLGLDGKPGDEQFFGLGYGDGPSGP